MDKPQLIAQTSPNHPDEVACLVSLVPSFTPPNPQEEMEVVENEKPDELDLAPMPGQMGSDQVFIFLVDRSGSMGNEKMQMAKDALKLFIQSLPIGAMFEVVSFGTDFSVSSKNREGYVNNDLNVKQVKDEIDSYSSNMGGTEILKPMKYTIQEYLINFDYVLPQPYTE